MSLCIMPLECKYDVISKRSLIIFKIRLSLKFEKILKKFEKNSLNVLSN